LNHSNSSTLVLVKIMNNNAKLQHDVEQALLLESGLHAEQVGVSAINGVVELGGTVKSYFEKQKAEDSALRVEGVSSVANEIKVSLLEQDTRSDSDIARIAISQMEWNYSVPSTVKVSVADGWVKFVGTVEAKYQKDEAERVLRSLRGIKGILNDIVIKPSVDVMVVKDKIVEAFKRSAVVDADNIEVEVDNGKVTLKGRIGSWAEGEEARRVAWSSAGVTDVEDLLTVALSRSICESHALN
jgi:osmotically-inducible protein OsmY